MEATKVIASEMEQELIKRLNDATLAVSNLATEMEELIQALLMLKQVSPEFLSALNSSYEELDSIMNENRLPQGIWLPQSVIEANHALLQQYDRYMSNYKRASNLIKERKQNEESILQRMEGNNMEMENIITKMGTAGTAFKNKFPSQLDVNTFNRLYEQVFDLLKNNEEEEAQLQHSPQAKKLLERSNSLLDEAVRIGDDTNTYLKRAAAAQEQKQQEVVDVGQYDPVISESSTMEEEFEVVTHNTLEELLAPKSNKVVTALKLGVGKMNIKECTRSNSGSQETVYFPTMFTAEQRAKCGLLQDRLNKASDIVRKTKGNIDTFVLGFTYLGSTRLILKRANNFVFGSLKPLLENIVVSLPGETLARTYNLFQFLDNSLILVKGDSFASLTKAFLLNSHLFEPEEEAHQRLGIQQLDEDYDENRLLEGVGRWLKRPLVLLEIKKTASLQHPHEVNEKLFSMSNVTDKPPYFVLKTVNEGNVQYAALVPFVPGNSRGGVA